ncbi:MAG: metallophosphoesterase family protein [Lachnospiraceae bacterium]|nr:metallophosphoesterase family protein [Lachnospiraceae bacterium]
MRRRIFYLGIAVLLCISIFTGCTKKSDVKETTTLDETTSEKQTEEPVTEKLYELDREHIYDGISRVAVTFFEDSTTKMGLSWYSPKKSDYCNDIEIIEKDKMKLIETQYVISQGDAAYDSASMYHQAEVKGLTPGTEYYFRVGDKKANQWSDYGTFKTASADITNFKFVAVTDTQNQHLADAFYSANTMEEALKTAGNSAFILHSGDFVDNGNHEDLWMGLMNTSKEVLMNNIIAPAVGNHEEEDNAFWQHFKLPHTNNHKTTGIYYSYDYGKTHFVVLDTNKVNSDAASYIDDEQLEWLEEDLKTAKENGTQWIIVNMHKGLYTIGEHADNEKFAGENGARLRVGKVFEDYGVDLVIQGHDHCPSVSKPIKQGKVSEDGIIYINTGSAGAKAYTMEEELMSEEYYALFDYKALGERPDDVYQNFAVIDVSEEKIKVIMYEINLLAVENTQYVISEFEITK